MTREEWERLRLMKEQAYEEWKTSLDSDRVSYAMVFALCLIADELDSIREGG